MNTRCTQFEEGRAAAADALSRLTRTASHSERRALIADAIGELIDASLCWNTLHPTQIRLHGFADVLAAEIGDAPERQAQADAPVCCAAWHKFFARVKRWGNKA